MEISPFGDRAVIITEIDDVNFDSVYAALNSNFTINPYSTYTVRKGLDTIMVESSVPGIDLESVRDASLNWQNGLYKIKSQESQAKTIEIPCVYDGGDLKSLSDSLGMESRAIVSIHKNTIWKVALVGFAPGFPYLIPFENKDTKDLFDKVSRLSTPRPSVPAGSIAIAAGMSAIYPSKMPGGWNLIGRTEAILFNPKSSSPSLLNAEDLVRFVEIQQ